MTKRFVVALAATIFCAPAVVHAEPAQVAAAEQASAVHNAHSVQPRASTIPAGLTVPLSIKFILSSNGSHVGQRVAMMVSQDVISEGVIVIPKGTPAVGEVTMRSGRGLAGRPGRLELAFRYVEMDGVRVPLEGKHSQEGKDNAGLRAALVPQIGPFLPLLVTGHSARIVPERHYNASTIDPLPVLIAEPAPGTADPRLVRLASTYTPSVIDTSKPPVPPGVIQVPEGMTGEEFCRREGSRRSPQNHNLAERHERQCLASLPGD
jgi:hypothetical protein